MRAYHKHTHTHTHGHTQDGVTLTKRVTKAQNRHRTHKDSGGVFTGGVKDSGRWGSEALGEERVVGRGARAGLQHWVRQEVVPHGGWREREREIGNRTEF